MKQYRAFDIQWDTDEADINLPEECIFELEDDQDPSIEGADALSDEYGWCLFGFNYEEVK